MTTTAPHFIGCRMRDAGPLAPNLTEAEIQAKADAVSLELISKPTGYSARQYYHDGRVALLGYVYFAEEPVHILVKAPYCNWTIRCVPTRDPELIDQAVAEFDPPEDEDGSPTKWFFMPSVEEIHEIYS